MSAFRDAARDNHLIRQVILLFAFVGLFTLVTDESLVTFVPMTAILLSASIGKTAADAYDRPRGIIGIPLGVSALTLGGYWFLTESPMAVVPAFAVIAGGWFTLDGIQQFRRGHKPGPSAAEEYLDLDDSGETMLRFQLSGTIARAINDEPRTISELAADLDLTESRVERALTVLLDRDMVYRRGDVYYANDAKFGKLSLVTRLVRWIPLRIVRPLRGLAK